MKKWTLFIVMVLAASLFNGCITIVPASEKPLVDEAKPTVMPTGTEEAVVTAEPTASSAPELAEAEQTGKGITYYLSLTPKVEEPFTPQDWSFCGLPFRATSQEIIAAIGEPDRTENVEWEASGDIYDYHFYAFGDVEYKDKHVEIVNVTLPGYPGPKGIEVGDTLENIITKFYTSVEKSNDEQIIFYRENANRDNIEGVPPYGVLWTNYLGTKILKYVWDDVAKYEGQTMDEVEDYTVYEIHYSFIMDFDEQDVLTEYTLYYGPDAE